MLMFHFSSCGTQNTNILFSTIDFRVRVPGQKCGHNSLYISHTFVQAFVAAVLRSGERAAFCPRDKIYTTPASVMSVIGPLRTTGNGFVPRAEHARSQT